MNKIKRGLTVSDGKNTLEIIKVSKDEEIFIRDIRLSKVRVSQKRALPQTPYREVWVDAKNVGRIPASRTLEVISLIHASQSTEKALEAIFNG